MNRLETALINIECQQFLNRVTLLTDREDWPALAACYTENAVLFRPSDANTAIKGRSAILASFEDRPPRTSCHILSNSVFEIESSEHVSAFSRIWLITGPTSETKPVKADSKLLIGSMIDKLVYQGSKWLIHERRGSIELNYSYV